jgi:pilus assembly protein CpaE
VSDRSAESGQNLKAVLICPDAALAHQFLAIAESLPGLTLAQHLDAYPAPHEMVEKVRQTRSDAVVLDVGSDRSLALALIAAAVEIGPHISVVGLNRNNDPDAILQCLRSGGSEFFSNPFSKDDVSHAVDRMLRRKAVEVQSEPAPQGRLIVFSPVKGGSGATTIACNVAHQIRKASKGRVLLVDFNLFAGIVSFILRASHPYTVMDALKHSGQLDAALWGSLVVESNGIDILLAPERPEPAVIDPYTVQEVLEYARSVYDYVVVDLGSVCEPVSMATLPVAHIIHLVCSTYLPSLFMMRRTIPLVEELGYGREQIRVLVNRMERRADLSTADMEKIFRASVHTTLPEDAQGVERALRDGIPLADNSDLGKAISKYVSTIVGSGAGAASLSSGVKALKELLSGT